MPNKVYDFLKWLLFIFASAAVTAYAALYQVMADYDIKNNWPDPGLVAQISAIVTVFLGAVAGISNAKYQQGGGETGGNADNGEE